MNKKIIIAKNNEHLALLIEEEIASYGNNCDLNHIDVSQITDMSYIFFESQFNGNISQWDVSNVTNMNGMFADSKFNGDISNWNLSKVTSMNSMFYESKFIGDISNWEVSKVKNMSCMFARSDFNGDISKWDVSNVIDMEGMFLCAKFTGNINAWTPYVLKNSTELSNNPEFNIPYWGNLKTNTEIREAISIKQKAELEKELSTITNNTIKHKVKL